jgi:sialate O-acetylesterase
VRTLPDLTEPLAQVKRMVADPAQARREVQARQEEWYRAKDPGSAASPPWSATDLDTNAWKTMMLPIHWEEAGYPDFDGTFWFRRIVELPQDWNGADVELHLGAVDDNDTTWVNGQLVGATIGWDVPRVYRMPAGVLKGGTNVIVVRVLDTGAGGGLWGGDDPMRLVVNVGGKTNSISLTGTWLCRQGVSLVDVGWPPTDYSQSSSAPTVLYNGMIAPLLPYAIRGVIWYQGESNVGRERQYRTLFPAMIADWRQAWGEGNFPFLFVQIAPFRGNSPELREAQLLSCQHATNVAMAVTIDCGDANDIHPLYKQPVGARLALAARALAYGEKLEYSGPVFESMKIKGANAVLRFTHPGGGLVAKDGPLKGFTVAGADKIFHQAQAEIRGETVIVSSEAVPQPVAVRYGWAGVAEGNLYNRADLPASPFRTDVD